jgi:beta-glucosidase-like glycosyl hydrolase
MTLARLLLPALRWSSEQGFDGVREVVDEGLRQGVGGFILFGGRAADVRALTDELRERSRHPLLIASDLERGAGQQFRGATPLPPLAALGWLDDPETTRRAGELTAREARALGINWVYAPTADVDLEPRNPIIGTRAFGTEPESVARHVASWIEGCAAGGALSCAKHFPGHGRTVGDSHIERPCVDSPRAALEEDLEPFRAAIGAGVDSMMTAHVCYPALDGSRMPATLSAEILGRLLRRELGFSGLVVTDALIMEGFSEGADEGEGAVLALAAGCDVLLYPQDTAGVIATLEAALAGGRLDPARVEEALGRIAAAAERHAGPGGDGWGAEADRRWALATAVRSLRVLRGAPSLPAGVVHLIEIDDDLGGPYPAYPRDALPAALQRAGVELSASGAPLVALYSDIRAWKGRPGISETARERVRAAVEAGPETPLLLFAHPRLAEEVPWPRHVLAGWGGEGLMQEAAAAWLTGSAGLASTGGGLDR